MSAAIPKAEIEFDRNLGDHKMHRVHRYVSSLFLAAALATPVAIMAAQPQDASVQVRVYDKDHKDYHTWDANEDKAYGQYHSENRKSPEDFSKGTQKQQSQYWNWRHSHPDKD
jgi:hypothetical protein